MSSVYKAFISYSHSDEKWARWLHKALETYRVPSRLMEAQGLSTNRLTPIFRDRDELASSSDLSNTIKDALAASESLIVICSPRARGSQWVNQEIRHFLSLGRADRVFALLVDDPATSFPEAILEPRGDDEVAHEPLAADARNVGDGRTAAKLKLIAALLGVRYDDLSQREAHRRQRRLITMAGLATTGMMIMTGLALTALFAQREAEAQREVADQERVRAQAQTDKAMAVNEFLQSTFGAANPYEGGDPDVRLIDALGYAEGRIVEDFSTQPEIEAAVRFTVGMTYLALNKIDKAETQLRQALALRLAHMGPDHGDIAWSHLSLSGLLREQGDYAGSIDHAQTAIDMMERVFGDSMDLVQALDQMVSSRSLAGEFDAAREAADRALDLLRALDSPVLDLARGLHNRANVDAFSLNYAKAKPYADEALALRREAGEHPPVLAESLNLCGTIHLSLKLYEEAEACLQEAIDITSEIFGDTHLTLAIYKENLGNVWFRQQRLDDSITLLEDVLRIRKTIHGDVHDVVGRTLANLGTLYRFKGDLLRAQQHMDESLSILQEVLTENHPTLAYLHGGLGDLLAAQDRQDEALAHYRRALAIQTQAFGTDAWQTAAVDLDIGKALSAWSQPAQALHHLRRAQAIYARDFGPEDERTLAVTRQIEELLASL